MADRPRVRQGHDRSILSRHRRRWRAQRRWRGLLRASGPGRCGWRLVWAVLPGAARGQLRDPPRPPRARRRRKAVRRRPPRAPPPPPGAAVNASTRGVQDQDHLLTEHRGQVDLQAHLPRLRQGKSPHARPAPPPPPGVSSRRPAATEALVHRPPRQCAGHCLWSATGAGPSAGLARWLTAAAALCAACRAASRAGAGSPGCESACGAASDSLDGSAAGAPGSSAGRPPKWSPSPASVRRPSESWFPRQRFTVMQRTGRAAVRSTAE